MNYKEHYLRELAEALAWHDKWYDVRSRVSDALVGLWREVDRIHARLDALEKRTR
jgi:uncharacterized coiled-coil protein SlyX